MPQKEKDQGMSYWFLSEVMMAYLILSNLGRWYSQYPTSSVAFERLFGVMRTMVVSERMAMKKDAFEAELMFRSNNWLVKKLLDESKEQLRRRLVGIGKRKR